MRYPSDFKKYIRNTCSNLRWEFFVSEMEMNISYSSEPKLENEEVAATIDADMRYLNFRLTIYPYVLTLWNKKELKKINEILVHEFSHLLTDPLYEVAQKRITPAEQDMLDDIRERQTQRITNIILPLLKKPFRQEVKKKKRK